MNKEIKNVSNVEGLSYLIDPLIIKNHKLMAIVMILLIFTTIWIKGKKLWFYGPIEELTGIKNFLQIYTFMDNSGNNLIWMN